MEPMALSFGVMLGFLTRAIAIIKDPRQASNATRYSIKDTVLAAFSVFFMQCESFLEHQRQMHSRCGQDNAQSLFGLTQIPTTPQIRNILDRIAARELFCVFTWIYRRLERDGYLKPYHCLGGHLLVALDGTQDFSSQNIHCECCSSRTHKNGTVTYFHSAILPVIVAPSQPQVISLAPEFVTPQDGCQKQDCEVTAAKRWISNYASEFKNQPVTLLGDDLYRRHFGKVLCQNAFITRHQLTPETVASVVSAGRSRWKTENENHNVLKTKGYHLEHNFGHGQHHLASLLLALNLLAFLFHTVLHLADESYQKIRLQRGTRKGFFQDILSLTKYLLFDCWQHLIDFMLSQRAVSPTTDSS